MNDSRHGWYVSPPAAELPPWARGALFATSSGRALRRGVDGELGRAGTEGVEESGEGRGRGWAGSEVERRTEREQPVVDGWGDRTRAGWAGPVAEGTLVRRQSRHEHNTALSQSHYGHRLRSRHSPRPAHMDAESGGTGDGSPCRKISGGRLPHKREYFSNPSSRIKFYFFQHFQNKLAERDGDGDKNFMAAPLPAHTKAARSAGRGGRGGAFVTRRYAAGRRSTSGFKQGRLTAL